MSLNLPFGLSRCSTSKFLIDLISGVNFSKPYMRESKLGCFFCSRFPTSPRNAQPSSSAKSLIVAEISLIILGVIFSIFSCWFFCMISVFFSFSGNCAFRISMYINLSQATIKGSGVFFSIGLDY